MTPEQIQAWLSVISAASVIGQTLVDAVKNHARATLTKDDYVVLEQAWNADVVESATNAGIAPEPDVPLVQS